MKEKESTNNIQCWEKAREGWPGRLIATDRRACVTRLFDGGIYYFLSGPPSTAVSRTGISTAVPSGLFGFVGLLMLRLWRLHPRNMPCVLLVREQVPVLGVHFATASNGTAMMRRIRWLTRLHEEHLVISHPLRMFD